MDTVDTGSPRAVGPWASCGNCVHISISPYGTREAMLQLICSNLAMVHYFTGAVVGEVFTDNWIVAQ